VITKNARRPMALDADRNPQKLLDHADCYSEVCRLEREITRLRAELVELKARQVRETTQPDFSLPAEEW
jgi:hypothetical protein